MRDGQSHHHFFQDQAVVCISKRGQGYLLYAPYMLACIRSRAVFPHVSQIAYCLKFVRTGERETLVKSTLISVWGCWVWRLLTTNCMASFASCAAANGGMSTATAMACKNLCVDSMTPTLPPAVLHRDTSGITPLGVHKDSKTSSSYAPPFRLLIAGWIPTKSVDFLVYSHGELSL